MGSQQVSLAKTGPSVPCFVASQPGLSVIRGKYLRVMQMKNTFDIKSNKLKKATNLAHDSSLHKPWRHQSIVLLLFSPSSLLQACLRLSDAGVKVCVNAPW
ncbi:unnamed protein product [Symbiodinium sp. CCMP2456]|nr:unnamed protein product [Symbiodinium sp. CCMP2456]